MSRYGRFKYADAIFFKYPDREFYLALHDLDYDGHTELERGTDYTASTDKRTAANKPDEKDKRDVKETKSASCSIL